MKDLKTKIETLSVAVILASLAVGVMPRMASATRVRDMTGINEKRDGSFTRDLTVGDDLTVTDLITTDKLTVTTTLTIPDASVATAKLIDSAVTSAKIGAGEVDTSEIRDSAVTTAKMSLSGNLRIVEGSFIGDPGDPTIADSGNASKGAYTLDVTSGTVIITCGDTDGCDITMGETNSIDGQVLHIINGAATTMKMNDTGGVSELAGDFDSMGIWDSITLQYITDRWVELTRSNN